MPIAVGTLALAYCLFVIGAASQLPAKSIQATVIPQITYFQALYGHSGPYVGLSLSLLAVISTFNAGILGGAQLIYLLAREGNLPHWCGTLSLRSGCPVGAILLLGTLATASSMLVLTYRLEIPAALVGAAIMCAVYAGFLLVTIRLRALRPAARRPFRTFVPKWVQRVAAAGLVVIGVQTLFSEPASVIPTCSGLAISCAAAWLLALWSTVGPNIAASQSESGAD
jgi:ethanolamine permease